MSTHDPDTTAVTVRDRMLGRGQRYDVRIGESHADAGAVAHFTNMLAEAEGREASADAESVYQAWQTGAMASLIIYDTQTPHSVGSLNLSVVYDPGKNTTNKLYVYDFHVCEHTFGAGTAALEKVRAIAEALGLKRIEFVVSDSGVANERVYRLMGARPIGTLYVVEV